MAERQRCRPCILPFGGFLWRGLGTSGFKILFHYKITKSNLYYEISLLHKMSVLVDSNQTFFALHKLRPFDSVGSKSIMGNENGFSILSSLHQHSFPAINSLFAMSRWSVQMAPHPQCIIGSSAVLLPLWIICSLQIPFTFPVPLCILHLIVQCQKPCIKNNR